MNKAYRNGALGAMMDKYERAASELRRLVEKIPDDEFVRIVDPQEIESIIMETGWGVTYDLEQLLEHASVHLLRHRRQIEKFMLQVEIAA